jgi:hypothetical protein
LGKTSQNGPPTILVTHMVSARLSRGKTSLEIYKLPEGGYFICVVTYRQRWHYFLKRESLLDDFFETKPTAQQVWAWLRENKWYSYTIPKGTVEALLEAIN